jgi:hypothetical protein
MNLLDLPQECLDNILERLLRSRGGSQRLSWAIGYKSPEQSTN